MLEKFAWARRLAAATTAITLAAALSACSDSETTDPVTSDAADTQTTDAGDTQTGTDEPTIVYEVVFTPDWGTTAPPDGAHFSPVLVASHAAGSPWWAVGENASAGLAELATAGNAATLEDELAGTCTTVIGSGISAATGETRFTIELDANCPALSLASMVGPSPDWFVGLSDQVLHDGAGWVSTVTVPAALYDAGRADGDAFAAATGATEPPGAISQTETSLGTITLTRLTTRCVTLNDLPTSGSRITSVQATAYPGNALRQTITFETDAAAEGVVVFWADGETEARVSDTTASGTSHSVTLVGLLPETTYHFRAAAWFGDTLASAAEGTFTIGALPSEVPAFVLESSIEDVTDSFYQNVAHSGYTLINYVGPVAAERTHTAFVILDEKARVIWYELVPIVAPWSLAKFEWTEDRTLVVIENKGTIRELRLTGEVLRQVEVTDNLPLHHEIFRLGADRFVALTSPSQIVDLSASGGSAETRYDGDGIVIVNDAGEVIWQWSTFDVLNPIDEPYGNNTDDGGFRWLNANALTRDLDGNYLVNLRLASQILKIDASTGEIIWRLGGEHSDFTVEEAAVFLRQHHLSVLEDGRILMFDNGTQQRGYSRALEIRLDHEAKTARFVWEHKLPEALFSAGVSGATRLDNGNTLVVSGRTTTILNVTRQGEVVWQATGPDGASYRAFPVSMDTCEPVKVPSAP